MAITKQIKDFPGNKTFLKLYNSIPGSPLVKNIVTGVLVAAAAVAIGGAVAITVGGASAGLVALAGAFSAFLGAGLLVQVGVIAAIGALWYGVRTAAGFAYSFNWNISDKEIENQIKAAQDALYRPLGEATGKLVGWIACGFAPGAFTFAFAPATTKLIMSNLSERAAEEMKESMAQLASLTLQSQAQTRGLKAYGSLRKWIKRPGTPLHGFAVSVLGKKGVEQWGKADGEAFVISNKIDEKIDEIKDTKTKNFLEGVKEGFEEGCQEAAMTISTSITEQIAAMKLAAQTRSSGRISGTF